MILLLFSSLAFWSANQDASPQAPQGVLPRVVATNPAADSIVPAGPLTLSATFDRPMAEDSYSFVRVSVDSYPDCEGRPALSEDRRTYSLSCTVAAGRQYELWFNSPPYMNFRSQEGAAAEPYRLRFQARD